MSDQAGTPQKSPRRSRRPSRKAAGDTRSHKNSLQPAELSADSEADKNFNKPTRILRRGDPDTFLEVAPANEPGFTSPHTPTRPKSMYAGAAYQQQDRNTSAPEKSRENKGPPKVQGRKQSAPVPSMSDTNSTTKSGPRRESAPPNRANQTPTKAYAGPTFHASPAASSLPLPKFYSKSVPNVNKTKSLKAMMEQETPGTSSGSEGSPSPDIVKSCQNSMAREESPLDIFFRADRKAKGPVGNLPDVGNGIPPESNANDLPSGSPKPARNHSRHSTAGGVFPLEMDGVSSEVSSGATSLQDTSNSKDPFSVNPQSCSSDQSYRDEQRKAQTIALKKLLYSPRPQISQSNSVGPRPPSSKLRKEIPLPNSPESTSTPELPATPTPSRVQQITTPLANNSMTIQNGYVSRSYPITPSEKPSQGHFNAFAHATSDAKSIENDLRRILKLDVLGDDGVAGH